MGKGRKETQLDSIRKKSLIDVKGTEKLKNF